jgi:hypothetical protein
MKENYSNPTRSTFSLQETNIDHQARFEKKRAKAAVKTRQLWQGLVLVVCQKGK